MADTIPVKKCPKLDPHPAHDAYSLDFTLKNTTGDPRSFYHCPGEPHAAE